jgi:hypothetical protein
MAAVLAYVFWHVATRGTPDYEERLRAFHGSLRGEFERSTTFALPAVPWLGAAPGYEDWYLVDDWAALGRLNEVAVSGARREPHDAAAEAAHAGIAGVMAHVAGPLLPERPGWAAWLGKPAGMAYEDWHAELAGGVGDASAWQRQMVLGPASEYCVLAGSERELPWPVDRAWPVRVVV